MNNKKQFEKNKVSQCLLSPTIQVFWNLKENKGNKHYENYSNRVFEATAYQYADEELNKAAKKNDSLVLTNPAAYALRRAERTLKPEFKEVLEGIKLSLETLLYKEVKSTFSTKAGCSMCPCSPGFEIKAEVGTNKPKLIAFWVNKDRAIYQIRPYTK